jgi:tetratricopeptide (TPR) repeat protein
LALAGSELGMYEDAERNGRLGYFLALQAGDDETASNIATTMVHLVGDRMGRVDDGLLWADSAVALVERAHGGPTRRASAKYSRGSVLHTKGDFEAAIAEFEAALELLEGDESERALFLRGAIENNLGVVYFDQSDTTRALEHFEASNRYATQLYGEGHPQTALSLLNVGSVRSKSGDPEAGIEDIKRAGEIFEKAWGKNHPNTLAAHGNIGSTLMEMGRYDEALQEYEAALAGFDARQESPPQLTRLMTSAAMAYATVERFDEALQWIRRDITLLETRHAEPYLETANAYYALGNILNRQERYDESVEALEHARDLAARASSEDHPLAIQARHAIGTALLGAERYDEALPHLEAALVAAKGNGDLGEDVQARIRFHLGVALWSDPEQHVRAHELVQEARTRAGDDAKSEALRDEIDAWLRQHPAP